ncbi:MAG TPA: proton-conducting transporter membrane subunit, partial [Myxococcota bacterium]|nr:proton-conducting transporter membrane subunit [Myxococcota bacterium]
MGEWNDSLDAALIRWIAILPLASAAVHGLLIGLVRARISQRSIWAISLSALSAAFVLSGLAIFELLGASPGEPILDSMGPWIGGGVGSRRFSAELSFQLDPLSGVFCLTVTSIALAVYLFTLGAMRSGLMRSGLVQGEAAHRTFAMLDLLVGSTLVLILADNFLLFFLGWAGIGVASQLFASFERESPEAARAGATTFVIGRIGDLGLLGALLLLFDGLSRAGAPALTFRGIRAAFRLLEGQGVALLERGGGESPLLLEMVGLGLVLAALTKCAQLPLHVWLPGASGGPVPAAALMQSVTTVMAGVYVLLRFSFLLESAPLALSVLVGLGAATMLLASLAAAT